MDRHLRNLSRRRADEPLATIYHERSFSVRPAQEDLRLEIPTLVEKNLNVGFSILQRVTQLLTGRASGRLPPTCYTTHA
jgi:hypothetical protein